MQAQNDCPAEPETGKFDPLTYIKASTPTDPSKGTGIWLGQGTILRNGSEVRPAFIPSNHPEWALAIAVAWNYSRNVIQRVEYPQIGYWLGTVVQETELGCVTGTTWTPASHASNNMANATTIMNHDGCYQIEGPGSAYGQLNQNYPLGRFPLSMHPNLIMGPTNFETSSMVKSYFDVYTAEVYNNQVGWDIYQSIDCTTDPYAYIKTSASGYNGGINAFAGNASKFNGSQNNNNCWGGMSATTANYANDVAKWVSVLENNTSYCEYPTGSSFDSYYNNDMTWTMVSNYINSIKIMYPEVNWASVTASVQATFNSLAVGGVIKFEQMGDVIDAIVLNLPRDYPQTVEGSPIGVDVFGCSGKKVPYGHFELLNGTQSLCIGESVTLNMVVDAGGGTTPTFKWYKTSAPATILATTQSFTITPTVAGSEVYAGEICNTAGCFRLGCNNYNSCMDSRDLCGVKIDAKQCNTCSFTATANSVNTPCKGSTDGKINLTFTNTPAKYIISYTATTPAGTTVAVLDTLTGNTATINNIRDGSYNIQVTDVSDPTCKARTTVIVGYNVNTNFYVDANILSTANCVANLKAEVKELPAPCNWKVRVHVPVYFWWENAVNFGVTTSTGLANSDHYTRTAPQGEIDPYNPAQIYESVFSLNTGDDMTFELALTNTPGASQIRDYQITVWDENNVQVYTKLVKDHSAQPDAPFTAGNYKVTCPATIPTYTFTWSPALNGESHTNTTSTGSATVDKSADVVYSVTAISSSAPTCPLKDVVTVNHDPSCNTTPCVKPSATISGGAGICNGDSTQLSVALTGTQPWKIKYNNGGTPVIKSGITSSPYTFYVKTAGTYKVDSVWDSKCDTAGKGSAVVTVNPSPSITISGDTSICAGETATLTLNLTGTAPYNIVASLGSNSVPYTTSLSTYTLPITVPGTYTLKVTDATGCSFTKKVTVIVSPLPTLEIGPDQSICSGSTVTLDAGAVFPNYAWTGVKTGTNKTIVADLPGKYKLVITDANGCKASDSLNVAQGTAVVIDFGGSTKTICQGTNVVLQPTVSGGDGNYTYKWSNAASGSANSFTASAAGYYTLEVTDGIGCKDKDSANVTVSTSLTVNLADATICSGDSIILNSGYSGAGYGFTWNTGATTPTIVAKTAGKYKVVVDNNGCSGTDSMTLTLNTLPTANLGADKNVCAGSTVVLDAGSFKTYAWSTTESTQTVNKGVGTYMVTVEDNNGCKDSDTINVVATPKPSPNVIVDQQTCPGSNVTFDISSYNNGNGPYTYKWDNSSTASTLTLSNVAVNSLHYVDVTDKYNCTGRDTANVIVKANLSVQITGTPDTAMCAGSSITLASNYNAAGGYNLSWSTGSTADNIVVSTAGNITLTVDDGNGCSGSDVLNVVVHNAPDMTLIPVAASVCSGDAAVLGHNYGAGYTYLWTPGNATTATISTTNGGAYTVVVTNTSTGCFADTSVTVTSNSKPLIDLGNSIDTCAGVSMTLADISGQTGVTYSWTKTTTGAAVIGTSSTFVASTSDTYQLKITDANTCTNSDAVNVNFRAMPNVNLINGLDSAFICGIETINLNAGNIGMTYHWLPGNETTQTITVSTSNDYSVEVSNGNCKATDKVYVSKVVLPEGVLNDKIGALQPNYCFVEEKNGVTLSALGTDGITYNYLWNTGATTSSINITQEGTYAVTISKDKCQVSDVTTLIDYCPTTFFIPDAFTPNGDHKNDVFKIYASNVPNFEILIFNRWGEQIYRSTDINQAWDGTYGGAKVQQDVYVVKVMYDVNLETGKTSRKERLSKLAVVY